MILVTQLITGSHQLITCGHKLIDFVSLTYRLTLSMFATILLLSPACLRAGDIFCLHLFVCLFVCRSVCLFVHLLPTYLKNQWTYFNLLLQERSLIQGEELINFWSRSNPRWLPDCKEYREPFFGPYLGTR